MIIFLSTRLSLTLFNIISQITIFNILRWLVESSLISQALLSQVGCFNLEHFINQYHIDYNIRIIVKIPLLISMRFAEIQRNCFINHLQIMVSQAICILSTKV
ncbi:hypothetical protein I4U23_030805 [Adineta vaga]|nr:hypothetical protein I4U23_030805 [Adineta vaga]